MSVVNDFRAGALAEPPKQTGAAAFLAWVAAAFLVGGALVYAYTQFSTRFNHAPASTGARPSAAQAPTVKIRGGSERLGRPEAAPLLRTCMPPALTAMLRTRGEQMTPAMAYEMLSAAKTAAHVSTLAGFPGVGQGIVIAAMYGPLTECVYARSTSALCDPDNRALAAEVIGAFVSNVDKAMAEIAETPFSNRARLERLVNPHAKERVLNSLRDHLRDGRLIASDFGWLVGPEVRAIAREVQPVRDACAEMNG